VLAARLRGRPAAAGVAEIDRFFAEQPPELLVLRPDDVLAVVETAIARAWNRF